MKTRNNCKMHQLHSREMSLLQSAVSPASSPLLASVAPRKRQPDAAICRRRQRCEHSVEMCQWQAVGLFLQAAGSVFQARVLAACAHVCLCTPRRTQLELNVGGCPGAACLCTCMSLCAPRAQLNVCAWVPVQGTMVFLGFRHHAGSIKELADKWDTSNSIFTFNSILVTLPFILVTLPLNCAVNWCA